MLYIAVYIPGIPDGAWWRSRLRLPGCRSPDRYPHGKKDISWRRISIKYQDTNTIIKSGHGGKDHISNNAGGWRLKKGGGRLKNSQVNSIYHLPSTIYYNVAVSFPAKILP